jgi:hypothetical protein
MKDNYAHLHVVLKSVRAYIKLYICFITITNNNNSLFNIASELIRNYSEDELLAFN